MRTTTKLVLATLALGLFVGIAVPTAAAVDPQPFGTMDDCVHADPFADPPYYEVNAEQCVAASP